MPSVASDPPVQPSPRHEPAPGRLNPSARTPGKPFDELLDTTADAKAPPPARPDRPERRSASDRPTRAGDTPDARDPAAANAQAPGQPADTANPTDNPTSDQPPADPAPVAADAEAKPTAPVVADKDAETVAADGSGPLPAPDDANKADPPAAAAAAVAPTLPAAVAAAIVIPVAPPAATDPATTTADGKPEPTILPAAPTGVSTEPAQAQSPQAALAADAKTGIPTEDATSTKAAPAAATALAEPVLLGSPAATENRPDGQADKTDKAKATQPGGTARTAAPAHPAPTPQSADTPADALDKPAARALHPRVPAADHATAALPAPPTESRDIAPANAMPAQPNVTAVNPAASALTMPTLWPVTALRVDAAPGVAVPIAGLAVEIVSRAQDGLKRFDIRLDPPDLGRIDVRLDVDHNGRVTSRLIVERADTLDLLRRDAPSLERALQQAGLKTDGGIDFSLRDQSFRDQAPRDNAPLTRLIVPDDEPAATEAALRGYGRLIGLGGGVDIRV